MRKECPRSNKFLNGCKHWISEKTGRSGFHHGDGNCNFDLLDYKADGYGPFYRTTACNRLGNASYPDEYNPSNNYDEAIESIDLIGIIYNRIAPAYEFPNGPISHTNHLIGLLETMVKKIQAEIERLKEPGK